MKTSNLTKGIALFDLKTVLKTAILPAVILLIVIAWLSPVSYFTGSCEEYPLLSEEILPAGEHMPHYGTEKVPKFFFLIGNDDQLAYGLFFFVLGIGIWSALRQFGFLTNRKKTNVILSCGLSRRQLFINRCSASLFALTLAFIVPLTVTLFANLARLGIHRYIFSAYFLFIVSFFAAVLIGFTAGALCALLTGTTPEAALGSAALLLIPTEIFLLIQYFFSIFLKGYPGYYAGKQRNFPISDYFLNIEYAAVLYKLKWLNPLLLLYNPYNLDNISYNRNLWSVYSQHENGYFLSSKLDGIAQHILRNPLTVYNTRILR